MKKPIVIAICVGLVCLAIIAIPVGHPKRVAENTVIDEAGIYESPRGTQIVNVSREDGGRLKIAVAWRKGGGGATTPFQANSDWFMCFDSDDRLWTYVPEQDRHLCHCWYTTDKSSGTLTAGELGGWQGVPQSFLARLPESAKATYAKAQTASELKPKG